MFYHFVLGAGGGEVLFNESQLAATVVGFTLETRHHRGKRVPRAPEWAPSECCGMVWLPLLPRSWTELRERLQGNLPGKLPDCEVLSRCADTSRSPIPSRDLTAVSLGAMHSISHTLPRTLSRG